MFDTMTIRIGEVLVILLQKCNTSSLSMVAILEMVVILKVYVADGLYVK